MSVVRNIDQLSVGKVDLLVLVSTGRTVQCKLLIDVVQVGQYKYKLNAQSLRLFGLHSDVNDAHRASANRLQKKKNRGRLVTKGEGCGERN